MNAQDALQVYLEPRDTVYAYGLDSSWGRGGDFGSLTVLDVRTGEEAVLFRSMYADQTDLAQLARELHDFGYRVAKGNEFLELGGGLVPEANDPLLMKELERRFADAQYFYLQAKPRDPKHPEERPTRYGFWTGGSKKLLLDTFSSLVEQGKVRWHNPWLSQEAGRWVATGGGWDYQVKGEMRAVLGHGDTTMSFALACMGVLAWNEKEADREPFVQEPPKPYMSISGRAVARMGRR